jgi:putative two-component system response regulator
VSGIKRKACHFTVGDLKYTYSGFQLTLLQASMKRIFVVDDNLTNLLAAKNELESYYHVFTMSSATKMIELLKKITPDLILLDIKMPEMDGFEALACLKSNSLYSDIPVIFLTGDTDAAIEARGLELGVIDFITKPFSPPVLLNRIKTHLDRE